MKKPKADFDFFYYKNILCIIDLNQGNMSVTNCIEDIVEYACGGFSIPKYIIYRDSDKYWDGWDHKNQEFIPLQVSSMNLAIEKIQEYYD
jgi:hypothetical protein